MLLGIYPEPTLEERRALIEALRRRDEPDPIRDGWRRADAPEGPYATARPRKSRGAARA